MSPMSVPAPKRDIVPGDILSRTDYLPQREQARREMAALKRHRRVEVGPFTTFYFENWFTIRHQIQEMLYIENGGDAQVLEEIGAYRALIPQGRQLIATVMIEVDDPIRRRTVLGQLGHIEAHMLLNIDGEIVRGVPDAERENTSPEGKASAVQFVTFSLTAAQAVAFRTKTGQILLGFDHPHYGHLAVMPDTVRSALAEDL